jgi:hypothetical protein
MYKKLRSLFEALSGIPGKDKGFEELHQLDGEGKNGHRVYVQIKHLGDGHHKVTALFAKPGQDKGTVHRNGINDIPKEIREKAVHRTFGSVKSFMKDKQWNSITLGGSDDKNRELYRNVSTRMADASGGQLRAIHGKGAYQAATRIERVNPIKSPQSSGVVSKPENDDKESFRKQIYGGSGRSSNRSSGSSGESSRHSSGSSGDPWLKKQSGYKKTNKNGSEIFGSSADSGASLEGSGASGESSAASGGSS